MSEPPDSPASIGSPPWWQEAVFYQIYPRSFCRGDPEGRRRRLATVAGASAPGRDDRLVWGSGDLAGIRRHLDHLSWLGVDAIWLSPFYPSPMKDFGYDVSDYCDVDPLFGSLEDFDLLLAEAHQRGLRVVVDFVPNHTSDEHPWFKDARSSRDAEHRSWYIWRDPDARHPGRPPNNWKRAFGEGPAWTFDETTEQWYLHLFLPGQPDLDWSNEAVVTAMEDVMGYWLDRGVDGFRIDVVHALGKDPALPDAPPETADVPWSAQNDDPRTHGLLRRIRSYLERRPRNPVAIGEVYLPETARIAPYYGHGDELHLAFNFPAMFCPFEATCFRRRVAEIEELLGRRLAWPTWVLSSHDGSRHRTRYGRSEARARAAAVVLLGMRGTPFVYAGEELGLEDADVPPEVAVDPGGRDGPRAPIPWDGTSNGKSVHGWSLAAGAGDPWLPFPPDPEKRNVADLMSDETSILHLYRRLISLRKASPALRSGELELLVGPDDVLAVRRWSGDEELFVLVNFKAADLDTNGHLGRLLEPATTVEVTTGGEGARSRAGAAYAGVLGPEEGVILSRRRPSA